MWWRLVQRSENDAWFTWLKNITYNIILKAQKKLFISIHLITATVSKRVLQTRFSRELCFFGKVWDPKSILDFLLLACTLVLSVLLAFTTYFSFFVISLPACGQ